MVVRVSDKKQTYNNVTKLLVKPNLLIKKIEILTDAKFEENIEEINRVYNKLLDQLKTIIYDKKKSKFYISKESKTSLNLVVALENLNFFIDNVKKDELILLKEKLILLKDNIIKYDIILIDKSSMSRIEIFFISLVGVMSMILVDRALSNYYNDT